MKPTDREDRESLLEEAATEWLLEREEGFLPARAEAFAEWCASDPRHAATVARVERTLALLAELPSVRPALEARLAHIGPRRRWNFRRWRWAAGLAAAAVVGALGWWPIQGPLIDAQSYTGWDNVPRRISLPDGSVVDLNARARLNVRFTEGQRHVNLLSGEAHFQVAHNAARPFIVSADGVAVCAIGTAFDVQISDHKIDVLVSEGKVKVEREETSLFFTQKRTPVVPLLVAGERTEVAPVGEGSARIEKMAPAKVHALLSWQDRMTSFTDVPLSEMVARINRCNTIQLVIGDPQLGDRKVGGVIDLSQVETFVRLLEQDGEIISERTSAGEIVLHRSR